MYNVTVTINYKDGHEEDLPNVKCTAHWAMLDYIDGKVQNTPDATSFVIVITRARP